MKKFLALSIVALFVFVGVLLPAKGQAQTMDIQAQIQALMVQLQTLQTQLTAIQSQSVSGGGQSSGPQGYGYAGISTTSCSVSDLNGLQQNSRGSAVSKLQGILRSGGYMQISPTGFFGTITQAALKSFQGENGLNITGLVDDATLQALGQSGSCTTQPPTNIPTLLTPPIVQSSIIVTHPQAGYSLDNSGAKDSGLIANVQWAAKGVASDMMGITLLNPNGTIAKIIADNVSNTGSYAWQYDPFIPNGSYKIAIAFEGKGTSQGISGIFTLSGNNPITPPVATSTQPFITSISPNQGNQGQTVQILINGSGFMKASQQSGNGVSPTSDRGFQLTSTQIISDYQMKVTYAISSDATVGPRNITVLNSNTAAFNVIGNVSNHTHGTASWNYGWDDFTSSGSGNHSQQIINDYQSHPDQYGLNPIGDNGYVPNPYLYGNISPSTPTNVLRLYKACADNWIDRKENIPVAPGGYANYTCTNRYQQQCIADGSFDNYYDEACLYGNSTPTSTVPYSTSTPTSTQANIIPTSASLIDSMSQQLNQMMQILRGM
jgi:peptidoglycan hydrolase-like protein with peptidoglycan-binding domain